MKRWCVLLLIVAACGRTQTDIQRDYAKSLYPASLGDPDVPPKKTRTVTARVYADEDHQNMTLGWQVRFYRQMQRANRVLEQQFGVTVEIESARPWPRAAGLSSLDAALFDLERHDPGEDVDFIIGLTTPLPAVSASIHQLGIARLFGRHMVLRGMDDVEEFSSLSRALGKLNQEDWERLYNARVRHKEAVVLLHEIGHTLGALHARDQQNIMNTQATQYASFFSSENARIMLAALDACGPGRRDAAHKEAARMAVLAALRETKGLAFVTGERERFMAMLGSPERLARSTDGEFAPESGGKDEPEAFIPPPPPEPIEQAQALLAKGEHDAAWLVVEPLLVASPDDAQTVRIACTISMRRAAKAPETAAVCAKASSLVPDDPALLLMLAYVRVERGEHAAALGVLTEAEALLDKVEKGDVDLSKWVYLAELYRAVSAVSAAERVVEKIDAYGDGPDDRVRAVRAWATKVRDVYGLDQQAEVSAADEGVYLRGRGAIQDAVLAGRYDSAEGDAAQLARAFPTLPDPELVLCETYAEMNQHKRAEFACHAVLKRGVNAARAHALLGAVSFRRGRVAKATRHMEQAIALDPDRRDLWTTLAAAYRATGQGKRYRALAGRYEAHFKRPLE